MIKYWIQSDRVRDNVFIPKYYNPEIDERLSVLGESHTCRTIRELIESGVLSSATGDEIGKKSYGTGDIPFVRTSDISNWEIKTAPKQGVSEDIYEEYAKKQDVQEGDILFVRDGTYLIGTNCFITQIDKQLVYQSHLLKLRVNDTNSLNPHTLFLALNSNIVQRQVRSFQFTSDIIDTVGNRFFDVSLPIPNDSSLLASLTARTERALLDRMRGKAFVKHCPILIEKVLETGSSQPLNDYFSASADEVADAVQNKTVSSEFGEFESFWIKSDEVKDLIFVPKYYEPSIARELNRLAPNCELKSFGELQEEGVVAYYTGDEIGKLCYGTGQHPFIRTSDFANWEIKHDPKHAVASDIYNQYAPHQDVQPGDIFLVRDGTYLVGMSCIVTQEDAKSLFCGGLLKLRTFKHARLGPFLLLGLLNSYIVKRQIRTKQFTRDVIDTLGRRLDEVVLPIPRSKKTRNAISNAVRKTVESRIKARHEITHLASEFEAGKASEPADLPRT